MRTITILSLLLGAGFFTYRLQADPPANPLVECRRTWNRQGYTEKGGDKKNTLYIPGQKESYPDFIERLNRTHCKKEWLILVYMAADNDLSPFSFRDLWEMESIGSSSYVDVVVFQDHAQKDGMFYYHMAENPEKKNYEMLFEKYLEQKGTEKKDKVDQEVDFLIQKGMEIVKSPIVKEFPEGDSGDVKTLIQFAEWAAIHYPSERIMLVGWSHGQGFDANIDGKEVEKELGTGWDKKLNGSKQGGFAFDEKPKASHMRVTDLAVEMKKLLERLKRTSLEIFGSDACLNQQVEFAYEWKGIADYVFGSSTIVQKKGFNYHTLLEWFWEHAHDSTADLAKKIPKLYGGSVGSGSGKKYSSYYDPWATMATWTVGEMEFLKNALEDLAGVLTLWIDAAEDEIDKLNRTKKLRKVFTDTQRLGGVSNDLFNFLQVLGSVFSDNKPILKEVNSCRDLLRRSILSEYIGTKYRSGLLSTSLGVALWLPQKAEEWKEMLPKFSQSRFYAGKNSPWRQLMGRMF